MERLAHIVHRIVKRLSKDLALSCVLPAVYRHASRQPCDDRRVLFVENRRDQPSDNFCLLIDELRMRGYTMSFFSLQQGSLSWWAYARRSIAFVKKLARSPYVFLNDANEIVSCVPLRSDTTVVQLWHACGAFKMWGLDTAELEFGNSREQIQRYPFYGNTSLVSVSAPSLIDVYSHAMALDATATNVQALGVSRTDVFYCPGFLLLARLHVETCLPLCAGKKILLYMPTYRGHVASADAPDQLDIKACCRALSDTYILIIRNHPFVKQQPPIPDECREFALYAPGELEGNELLAAADVCITDYSSVMFDYALLDRPMIFFAYDRDSYDQWRGCYYDYCTLVPGPVCITTSELICAVQTIDQWFNRSYLNRFRRRFMAACDGHSTRRIADAVVGANCVHDASLANDMDEKQLSILGRKQNDCRAECTASIEIHRATQPMDGGISVIVPASNAMPELDRCLASLDRAYMGDVPVECILIDDVSQDSTGDTIRSFQKRHEDCTTTIHVLRRTMEHSAKSPAYPRNIGMQYARGRYVLFLDADDWLADGAIARMYQRAESWHSDVLLIRMHGEGGRSVPESMFAVDRPQVNPWHSSVMWTLGPVKVFRRSFLQNTHAHFSEAGMPEDIPFTIRALHDAHVVSVAADDDYIHIARREDNQNLSLGAWDNLDSNEAVYAPLMRTIQGWHYPVQHTVPLLRRLFVRDVFFMLVNAMFSEHDAEDYQRIKVIFCPWYVGEVYRGFAPWLRVILDAAFLGDPSDWQCVSHLLRTEVLQRLGKADTATSDYASMHKENTMVNGAMTSTAYSAERLRNEVQQSAEAVIALSQWSVGDQMLWCEYSIGSIQRRFEATHCLSAPVESVFFSISHTKESSVPDERVMHLSGHIRVPISVQLIHCDFYAHEVHGDGDAVIPTYCECDASACFDDDLLCRYQWCAKVPEQDIGTSVHRASISHHERWHLFLRIEGCIDGEIFKHSIRLGPHTSLACTHAFLQGWSCTDASFDDVQKSGVVIDDDRSSHDTKIKSHTRHTTIVPYVSDYGGWCLKRLAFFERDHAARMRADQTTQKYAQPTNVAYNSSYQASEVNNSSCADQSSTMSAAGGVDNANRS